MVSPPTTGKHGKTYVAIFADPIRSNVRWDDIEAMMRAMGALLSEGRGSRVRVLLGTEEAVFHRPHPEKECDKGALRSVRTFLSKACGDE